jgi:hypothetical protein
MSTRTEVNNDATKDVAARVTPSSSSLVQRKCACGGSAGMTGDCEECNDKRLSVQRSAITGGPSLSSFNHSLLPGVQTKLNVSEPGDKYEREADQVADAVMRNSDSAPDMEQAFGVDFSRVKIHSDGRQATEEGSDNRYGTSEI